MASENTETMDEVFWGTEAEMERRYAAALTMYHELSDVLLVAHVKRWLRDGKGLIASKSVSMVITFP